MRIKVSYSFSHEVNNFLNSLYEFKWHKHGREDIQEKLLQPLPDEFKQALKKAGSRNEAKQVIEKFLLEDIEKKKRFYTKISERLEKTWKEKGPLIQKQLEQLYDESLPLDELDIYLSSIPICPYNFKEGWIMVFANTSPDKQLGILTHELNHFLFFHQFAYLKKELGDEKFNSLKEALTVFTNPEEKGYPAQRKLRHWLKKQKETIPEIIEKGEWRKYLQDILLEKV